MLAGLTNSHPDAAMKILALPDDHPDKYDFVKFYIQLTDPDFVFHAEG
jgi:hypothetical protein